MTEPPEIVIYNSPETIKKQIMFDLAKLAEQAKIASEEAHELDKLVGAFCVVLLERNKRQYSCFERCLYNPKSPNHK
jgi:hypothetical protein